MKKTLLHIIAVTLLAFPSVSFAQAPNLGTCSSFALFTAVGAFNNVGATVITGNAGTNAGAFTGFPLGIVLGQIHVADAVSAQAAIDVATAYGDLNSVTCDSVIGTTLGNGQVLPPHTYCLGAASTLNGILILDGKGNPNSLFIIKINGALVTNPLSSVILIDSASPRNLYWQINGALTLSAGSIFKGTAVASGAISLLDSASLQGRGLTTAGAINLFDNIVTADTQQNLLPIELLSFKATQVGESVQLDWSTASETNNKYFTVQCSNDGDLYKEVLQVPGAGNSSIALYYSAIDDNPYQGISYYKLKQTDFDGNFTYSRIEEVNIAPHDIFSIFTNPVNQILLLKTHTEINAIVELKVFNLLGSLITSYNLYMQKGTITYPINVENLTNGTYFLQCNTEQKTTMLRFIKQ
jgi:hypothetical protein